MNTGTYSWHDISKLMSRQLPWFKTIERLLANLENAVHDKLFINSKPDLPPCIPRDDQSKLNSGNIV